MPFLELLASDPYVGPPEFLDPVARKLESDHFPQGSDGWPAHIAIDYGVAEQFVTVPEEVKDDDGRWRGRVAINRSQWQICDADERQRLLEAIALDVLLLIGYRKHLPVETMHEARKMLGKLDILGGAVGSPAHKAWIAARRKADPEFDQLFETEDGDWDNPENAHPAARDLMRSEWLWDITDDFSPFGNDTGWDTMEELGEWLEEHPRTAPERLFREIVDSYPQDAQWNSQDESAVAAALADAEARFLAREEIVIAMAFGLLVRKGKVAAAIRDHAIGALQRHTLAAMKDDAWPRDRIHEMITILEKAPLAK